MSLKEPNLASSQNQVPTLENDILFCLCHNSEYCPIVRLRQRRKQSKFQKILLIKIETLRLLQLVQYNAK